MINETNFPEANDTQFKVFQVTDDDGNQRLYFHPVEDDDDLDYVEGKIKEVGFDDEILEQQYGIVRFFPVEVNI